MRKLIIITFLVAIGLPAMAQNWRTADSLRKALVKTNIDTAKANTLIRLAEFEIFKPGEFKNDLDSAAVYLGQAKSMNRKINSNELNGHIVLTGSHLAKERGQKEQGKALVERAIQVLSKGTDRYQLGQAYLAMAEYYDYDDPVQLRKELNALGGAVNAFKNSGYIEREAYASKMLGELDTNSTVSLQHLEHSLALYKSISYKDLQGVYDAVAAAYLGMQDYKQALNYDLQALKTAQVAHDTSMQLCEINNHIGIIYYKLLEFEHSIQYFKAALKTAEAYKNVNTIYFLTSNICNSNNRLKRSQEVLNILKYTLTKYPGWRKIPDKDCMFTGNFLDSYLKLKQYKPAKPYAEHLDSLINNSTLNKSTLSDAYAVLIRYYFHTKQYSRELPLLIKNEAASTMLHNRVNLGANNFSWFKLDTAQHNYKAAVAHLLSYKDQSDSAITASKNKQLQQLQVQFSIKEKGDSIKFLSQKTTLQQSNLQQANLVKNITFGGVALFGIIAGMLYRQSRLRKKTNKIITDQNQLITRKNGQLQELVTEKEWLLKEVHHRVKNNLHSVICLLEAQAAYLENDALQAIANSQHRIYTMSLIHQKLYQSEDVKTIDMAVYIPELMQYLRDSFDDSARIHFQLAIDPIQLNPSQAIPLALIINEAITNAIKYAFPGGSRGEITISLSDNGICYELEIADNGIGMPKKTTPNPKSSLGLELMKGLAKEIRGEITIENSNGVRILIVFAHDLLHSIELLQPGYFVSA